MGGVIIFALIIGVYTGIALGLFLGLRGADII
ncbi:MAG: cytochrome B6 [Xenococcaceae cyanobacterium MO_207.B15]|nr:cytochrome B6 [Xenococcaceae cyanobacterium MO_207.B15]MDJ0745264.1 cytochrome B6 [Xenococcaceae cyanobacterium MO_167.B27]